MSSRSPSFLSAVEATSTSSSSAHSRARLRRLSTARAACGIAAQSRDDISPFEVDVKEVVVCWNAQRPYDEVCDPFLDALSRCISRAPGHTLNTHQLTVVTKSKVVQKIQGMPSRLAWLPLGGDALALRLPPAC